MNLVEIFAYKSDQGLWARRVTAVAGLFIAFFGCHKLHMWLYHNVGKMDEVLWLFPGEILRRNLVPAVQLGIPISPTLCFTVGLALLAVYLAWEFVGNHEKTVEFLVETEKEMRKVSWPSWSELKASSVVVILVALFLGLYLFAVDILLNLVRKAIL